MTDQDRREEIRRRAEERLLTEPAARHAFRNDPAYSASIKQLIRVIDATDEAMAAEDISEEARDRVLYRLLFGEPPHAYEVVPDFREGYERMREREAAILRAMAETPRVPIPEEWQR